MSYNNYVDADAALRAAYDFDEPAVAVVKHNNPCGLAVATPGAEDPIADAHRKAHACDPLSAYGGVIAANRTVTRAMAETVQDIFTEVVVAPGFEPAALEILQAKKNIRLLELPEGFERDVLEYRRPRPRPRPPRPGSSRRAGPRRARRRRGAPGGRPRTGRTRPRPPRRRARARRRPRPGRWPAPRRACRSPPG